MHRRSTLLVASLVALGATALHAEEHEKKSGIAYYATLDRALEVAKETNRPILLVAAAPQCHGISGLW